jgi:hypothetical protein
MKTCPGEFRISLNFVSVVLTGVRTFNGHSQKRRRISSESHGHDNKGFRSATDLCPEDLYPYLKHASEVCCALACRLREVSPEYLAGEIARHFDSELLAIDGGLTLILLLFSAFVFRRVEDSFADVI